jgi:hypothetical protein
MNISKISTRVRREVKNQSQGKQKPRAKNFSRVLHGVTERNQTNESIPEENSVAHVPRNLRCAKQS